MASSCIVKILETTEIKPSPESPNFASESTLPLTLFDAYWFQIPPVERLFFYNLNDLTPADFSSEILPKLKHSLSLTLHHYLPIAGSLKWPSHAPKPFISYTPNNGVSLTVAQSNADFHRLTGNGIYEAVELHPLIPHLKSSDDSASILALQITLFPGKGFSIGITAHHTVLDGKTTTMFMKSWAYLCKQRNIQNSHQLPPELTPVFDRDVIRDPTGFDLDVLYLNQWLTYTIGNKSLKVSTDKGAAPNLVRATVTITPEDFKKMREKVFSKSLDTSKTLHLSTFALTLGYVSSCIVKARGGAGDRIACLAFTADCRSRLDPPISETYFGNCNVVPSDISKARGYMDFENGFAFGAEKVSNMVKGLKEKGVFEGAKDRLTPFFELAKEAAGSVQMITVAGSPRFDLYETDFGWGRAWKVVVVSIDKNEAISMAESRDEKRGIEVGLALKKPEMERLLNVFLKDFV
ncbi:hypothetical protein ERO13_A11G073100v2 [Gossypium hirsutum]|uniref:Malonyl-CoA:anthocyanidin 5-O-glucoside-6''-O-malonyltransferase n=1 Tax=Gossypium hirsutum TaxID=3635 RepID=A0ABM2Z5M9_GOSHI|nr:malonyl-CoA:anthocyanidin 5-O-glucoside-6''-O-malonyltransferase-like [Gossypium hirsutum]KAG4173662.1 hypothetical protein ERO13_A11G073100v2 [Gossypium hirsutum]